MKTYRLSFNRILVLMLAICAVVFLPGLLILAYGASIITDIPAKLTFETFTPHLFIVVTTVSLITFVVLWYADWAFPFIMRTFARLLDHVEVANSRPAKSK